MVGWRQLNEAPKVNKYRMSRGFKELLTPDLYPDSLNSPVESDTCTGREYQSARALSSASRPSNSALAPFSTAISAKVTAL